MRNQVKLAKIVGFKLVLVTAVAVAFLVSASIALAAWVGPIAPPPVANLPGFIFINGDAVVNSLNVGAVGVISDLNMNGNKITTLGDPTVPTDAANKNYVDTAAGAGGDSFWELTGVSNNNIKPTSVVTGRVKIGPT